MGAASAGIMDLIRDVSVADLIGVLGLMRLQLTSGVGADSFVVACGQSRVEVGSDRVLYMFLWPYER